MSLFLIAGSAGSGKSTVCRVLKERGFEAYDTDEDGLAKWQHNQTGYVHPKSSVKKEQRTPAFLAEHSWNVPRQEVEELAVRAEHKPIFLCGAIGNQDALRDLFAGIFMLYVDNETLLHRLATRTNNDWGSQPHERELTLQHNQYVYEAHKRLGSIIIDASRPVDAVADDIVEHVS